MIRSLKLTKWLLVALTAVGAVAGFAYGFWIAGAGMTVAGLCLIAWLASPLARATSGPPADRPAESGAADPRDRTVRPTPTVSPEDVCDVDDPDNMDSLVDQMLAQGRYSLLLRPQIAVNLTREQLRRAADALDEGMAIIPEGDVLLNPVRHAGPGHDQEEKKERLVRVEGFYLDRHAVTNQDYKEFVDAGGYEQISLWDESILPALLDFVDRTGHPGPERWENGNFPADRAHHPVVGISWYEAQAYSRWVGKRLPTDPEWVKSAAWPVLTHGTRPIQRKFPWGDTMDRNLTNLWGTRPNDTAPVDAFEEGASVGGIYQLIGNVWEWTTNNFGSWDTPTHRVETDTPMKSIRGGAFDTYFDTQAHCQFQSGDSPVARKHNIGFRCALGMCDVVSTFPELEDDADHEQLEPAGLATEE